jgi:hypothetical protein
VEGRDFHTPLLFILFACIFSIIIAAFALRQGKLRRTMEIFSVGVQRLSTSVLEPIPGNYSDNLDCQLAYNQKDGEEK